MSIPKKGSRKIFVDGEEYRWLIRHKPTYLQSDYGDGKINVAIEINGFNVATLHIVTPFSHPKDWNTKNAVGVTPRLIEIWIRDALKKGWLPKEKGPTFSVEPVI